MAAGKILLTTSRNPTPRIRTFCNELSRTMPNLVYVNRGKMSADEVAEKALDYEADRAVIVDRWHGGPGDIKLFKVEESGLISFPPNVHVARIRLQKEFEAARVVPADSIVVDALGRRELLLRLSSALSDFFNIPIKSITERSEESKTLMYLLQDEIGRVVITFLSQPNQVETGPRIIASSLEWQVQ